MIPDFKTYIKESMWGDIHRRNSGETVRKEDQEYINSINRMNFIEFFNYLLDTYLPTDSKDVAIYQYTTSHSDLPMIQIPIEEVNNDTHTHIIYTIKYNPDWNGGSFVAMIVSSRFSKCYPEELEQLKNKYYIEENMYFTPKRGKITNYACIELLDTLLSIVKKPCFQKHK